MRKRSRRRFLLGLSFCTLAALGAASATDRDLILFNHSPSIAPGFYVRAETPIFVGATVTVRARDVAPDEARRRGFDDSSDRFIKRVAAVAGAQVCSDGAALTIDGQLAAEVLRSSSAPPAWTGCRVLTADEVLLLGESPKSFDGRYWGPIKVALVEGVWRKL